MKKIVWSILWQPDNKQKIHTSVSIVKLVSMEKNFTVLSPGAGTHQVTISPSENYFIDSYSKPDVPTVSVLRDKNGKQIIELEKTDVARLKATGWKTACTNYLESS